MGQRPSDKKAKKVLARHTEGLSYRLIGRNLGHSEKTVMETSSWRLAEPGGPLVAFE